jgi:hypothetical protein
LPSRPHTSPPAGISGHAPTPPSRQAFLLPACLAAPPFAACPSPGGRCPPHCPDCTRQTFLHRLARTPHPSEGIPRNPCARTPRQAFPPPPAGFFLPSRPHTPPLGGHSPQPLRPHTTTGFSPRPLKPPGYFPADPAYSGEFRHTPTPPRLHPADFSSSPARTPRPRRDFSCPPDRTPTPRRTVHPAILRLHTHPTNPEAHHLPLTRRSLPPSTAVFFLWRLFRLCRTGMIYSQKTFYF